MADFFDYLPGGPNDDDEEHGNDALREEGDARAEDEYDDRRNGRFAGQETEAMEWGGCEGVRDSKN